MTTLFSTQASAVATTADTAIDHERRSAITLANQLILDGRPGRALYEMSRSVIRQNRIAGGGTVEIAPACPCGRRCAS